MSARVLVLAMLLIISAPVFAGNLVVSLGPTEQHIVQGGTPHFQISARAGSSSEKIMKFQSRGDLKDTYVHLLITKNNREVELPIAISDPGPVDEEDYVLLAPGHQLQFEHDGFPLAVSKLPAGTYSVRVSLRPDWRSDPVWSNTVTLHVGEHGS